MGDPASWWLDVRLITILRKKYILKCYTDLGRYFGATEMFGCVTE